jgi:hypothetical protein
MRNHTKRSSSGPSPGSPILAWIERGEKGELWVYTPSNTGTGFEGQRLMLREDHREGLRREDLQAPCPNGIFTGFCWICP